MKKKIKQLNLSLGEEAPVVPVDGDPVVRSGAPPPVPAMEASSIETNGGLHGNATEKASPRKNMDTAAAKEPGTDPLENGVNKSDTAGEEVGAGHVTATLADVLAIQNSNGELGLPEGCAWPANLDAAGMEQHLAGIADPQLRLRVEGCWLERVDGTLECGLRVTGKRRGIVLLGGKAETQQGEFQAKAKLYYPGAADRTLRYWMALGRELLKEAEPGYSSNEETNNYAAFAQKWTVSQIVAYERLKISKIVPKQLADVDYGGDAGEHSDQNEKKERSPFVRIETFATHLRRAATACAKVVTSAKRLNPDDCKKALTLAEKHLPEELQPTVRKIIAARQSAADQAATSLETAS
jgi:hypothetical protein